MKISKQELLSEALQTGFRPEIMEKALETILPAFQSFFWFFILLSSSNENT